MPEKNVLKYLGLVTELGLVVVVCIGGCLLLGVWLDQKFGTKALFTIVLLLVGIGAAFARVYRMVMPKKPQPENTNKTRKQDGA